LRPDTERRYLRGVRTKTGILCSGQMRSSEMPRTLESGDVPLHRLSISPETLHARRPEIQIPLEKARERPP
jgi:hypothetical protein